MRDFSHAVRKHDAPVEEAEAITFMHGDQEVTFFEPSSGQMAILLAVARRDMDPQNAGTFISMMFEMMDEETQRYFENRLLDRHDDFGLIEPEGGGLFDIFEALAEEWSARPTKQPSDYQPSQRATGRASTATTRAKARTSSTSRSRASSR